MKTMKVSKLHNRFMSGVAVTIFILNYPGILISLGIIAMTIFIAFGLKRYFGMGDVEMAGWSMVGFGAINVVLPLFYIIFLTVFATVNVLVMKKAGVKKLPGTPIFIGAFVLTAGLAFFGGLM
jgi:hypothetical protein